jgi:predicted esterase
MSGFVPQVEGFAVDLGARAGLPAAITHGTRDPVISVDFGRAAREQLETGGLAVTYAETPVPHTVDPSLLPTLRDWLPV